MNAASSSSPLPYSVPVHLARRDGYVPPHRLPVGVSQESIPLQEVELFVKWGKQARLRKRGRRGKRRTRGRSKHTKRKERTREKKKGRVHHEGFTLGTKKEERVSPLCTLHMKKESGRFNVVWYGMYILKRVESRVTAVAASVVRTRTKID